MSPVLELVLALVAVFAPLAFSGFLIEKRYRGRGRHHGASPAAARCESPSAKSDS
jgi:hypothetical protein